MIISINTYKKLYDKIYYKLPKPIKLLSSKLVFNIARKPFYDDSGNLNLKQPIICISADFEMAWAWRFSKRIKDAVALGKIERHNFPLILNKLNDLRIPITWATVGHLLLDSCERKNEKAHYDLPRPPYFENQFWSYKSGDWYDLDPCTDFKKNPEFYAPDLIESILKSDIKHDVGCHSFSHCDFSERNSSKELIKAELDSCVELMKKFGIEPNSFVYPGNQYGNFGLVKDAGFKIVRYKSNPLKEIGYPEKLNNNLLAIHDSLDFTSGNNMFDYEFLLKKFKKYINKSIRYKTICHFWFHPSLSQGDINNLFYPIVEYIGDLRDKGIIDIMTMKDISEKFNSKSF